MTAPPEQRLLNDSVQSVQDLQLLVIDGAALIEAVGAGDFDEARFRCESISQRVWSHNWSEIGNPGLELEVWLRHPERIDVDVFRRLLALLVGAIEKRAEPLRGVGP